MYHDEEWAVLLHEDNKFFEFLVRGGFQAGLAWSLILKRRVEFRKAFNNFDPHKVAKYGRDDIERLMNNSKIIRNKTKINAAVNNAQRFVEIQKEFCSFDFFIWKFVQGKAINNPFDKLEHLPTETVESKLMSKELSKRGFQFVGLTIYYAFMQATGLVNDHVRSCFRYEQIRNLRLNK
jgi:DNA-3-methyladenine glycosylase I